MKKSQYWQVVRGICIMAVIAIHCPTGTNGMDFNVWLGIRQIINFPVALFIFMSGYFVDAAKVSWKWVKARTLRLIVPFFLWSIIYTFRNALFLNKSFKELLFLFVTGKSTTPLYYILVLLQLTILTPILVKKNTKWLYFITPVYLIFIYLYNILTGDMPIFYETVFPAWFIFYILGMSARMGKFDKINIRWWWIIIAILASFGESNIVLYLGCSSGFASSQIRITCFVYSALIALWLIQNRKECRTCLLSVMGDCSFGIFFLHMLVMWVITKIVSILGVNIWLVKWIIIHMSTTVISFILVWTVRRLYEGKKILKYIGFE